MHILLIDDSSSTRSLLRTLINSGQAVRHEISEAASGEEALQKVGSGEINLPDLIIMDINMGGMSGYELCREFRQRHGTASDVVPYIIIVTANEGVDVINQALDCGANDYMPKPVNVKILQIRLRVAERLLSHAHSGTGSGPLPKSSAVASDTGAPPELTAPVAPAEPATDRQKMIASVIEYRRRADGRPRRQPAPSPAFRSPTRMLRCPPPPNTRRNNSRANRSPSWKHGRPNFSPWSSATWKEAPSFPTCPSGAIPARPCRSI